MALRKIEKYKTAAAAVGSAMKYNVMINALKRKSEDEVTKRDEKEVEKAKTSMENAVKKYK